MDFNMDNMYIILDYNLRIAFVMTFQKLMTSTNEKNIMQGKEDGSMFLKTIVLSTVKTKKRQGLLLERII